MNDLSGIELKVLRIRSGVKQYQLAQALGIPASVLSGYENGLRAISPDLAKTMTRAIEELAARPVANTVRQHGEVAGAVA